MPVAARLGDPIQHSNAMVGLLAGLAVGLVVGAAIVATGGAAAVVLVAGAAGAVAGGAGIGEFIGSLSLTGGTVTGAIATGSPNTQIDGVLAARCFAAVGDTVACQGVPPLYLPPSHDGKRVAQGSATVVINGAPAARVGDQIECGAQIQSGSTTVLIGGGQVTTVQIETEVPDWINKGIMIVGLASSVVLAGPVVALVGFAGGMIGGQVGSNLGGDLFGEGSDGQKIMGFLGGMIGGGIASHGAEGMADSLGDVVGGPVGKFIDGGVPEMLKPPAAGDTPPVEPPAGTPPDEPPALEDGSTGEPPGDGSSDEPPGGEATGDQAADEPAGDQAAGDDAAGGQPAGPSQGTDGQADGAAPADGTPGQAEGDEAATGTETDASVRKEIEGAARSSTEGSDDTQGSGSTGTPDESTPAADDTGKGDDPGKTWRDSFPPVDDATRDLARTEGDSQAQIDARWAVASDFYVNKGLTFDPTLNDGAGGWRPFNEGDFSKIYSELNGIDFTKPVDVVTAPDQLFSWSRDGGPQGQYYTPDGSTGPNSLGIGDYGKGGAFKVQTQYATDPGTQALASTATGISDFWSLTGADQPTDGGGTQYYIPDTSDLTPIDGSTQPMQPGQMNPRGPPPWTPDLPTTPSSNVNPPVTANNPIPNPASATGGGP